MARGQGDDQQGAGVPLADRLSWSIPEFCELHGFSRATYFNIKNAGDGPREMKVAGRILISREAAAAWRAEREAGAAQLA